MLSPNTELSVWQFFTKSGMRIILHSFHFSELTPCDCFTYFIYVKIGMTEESFQQCEQGKEEGNNAGPQVHHFASFGTVLNH